MKVVIYAEQYLGPERIDSLETFPRSLRFAKIGTSKHSIKPETIHFLTWTIDDEIDDFLLTEKEAEATVEFFKEKFYEFDHDFIGIFDSSDYPKSLEEFSKSTGVDLKRLINS